MEGARRCIAAMSIYLPLPRSQQTYYLLLNAGRLDLSTTLTDFVATIATGLASNVPSAWQSDSSAAPTGASALTALETCYWNYGPGCKTSPPSVTGNLLWTLHLVYLHAEYSQVGADDVSSFSCDFATLHPTRTYRTQPSSRACCGRRSDVRLIFTRTSWWRTGRRWKCR